MDIAARAARFNETDLYVVITESFCAGRTSLEVLDAVLEAGVTLIQLREKDLDDRGLIELAAAYRERTRQAGATLIIDDRVDIALAVDADGVHLGQSDLPLRDARRIAPDLLLGASTHNLEEALAAQQAGASNVNIGPIFTTQTKVLTMEPVGPALIDIIAPHLSVPFTCMGGIKLDNVEEVLQRGARHPAVVTAVTSAPDIKAAAQVLRDKVLAYR